MEIYINPPNEVWTTREEFNSFSYMDLACFFVNWKMCIEELDNGDFKIFNSSAGLTDRCHNNHRFKDLKWYVIESAELYHCTIPKGHSVHKFIGKHFKHLVLK